MVSEKNKKGDIPVTILVIGVVAVCIMALLSFLSSTAKVRNSFVGIGALEEMNLQRERNYFYKTSGLVTGDYEYVASIFDYAKENSIVDRKCNCGNDCASYAKIVVDSSSENGISDPLLLLSLMMQESTCERKSFSGSSVGLMQINLIHCGEYGLPADKEECKKTLLEDSQLNIDIGTKILKASYDAYKDGKIFQGCSERNVVYYQWEAALRGYNGWGCGKDTSGNLFYSQDNYVEEVMARYERLKDVGNYAEVLEKGNIFQLETTSQFPFIKRKDKFLFSAKFIEE